MGLFSAIGSAFHSVTSTVSHAASSLAHATGISHIVSGASHAVSSVAHAVVGAVSGAAKQAGQLETAAVNTAKSTLGTTQSLHGFAKNPLFVIGGGILALVVVSKI